MKFCHQTPTKCPPLEETVCPSLRETPACLAGAICDPRPVQPCGTATGSGGFEIKTTRHGLGVTAGWVQITYDMFGIPDAMDVYYDGDLVASTGGMVSGTGNLYFYYAADPVAPAFCTVRVTGSGEGTAWNYTLFCPNPELDP